MGLEYTKNEKIFNYFNKAFLTALLFVIAYPLYYILMVSFSEPMRHMAHQGILWNPLGFTFDSYKTVLQNSMIGIGYRNTIVIVIVGVALNLTLTSFGAYFLSRPRAVFQKQVMWIIVFTMFFSGGLIPFYLLVRELGLYDTLWSLILPNAIGTFNLIIMRTAFMCIPYSLEESAKMDGAGHFTILWRIVMPLSLPTVAVIILYYGVHHWNAWFNAIIFIKNRNLYPLQLVLREILIVNDTASMTSGGNAADTQMVSETIKYSTMVIATFPILCLYPFLQKYFVKGIMIGAVKG
ncbi:MAG: carbohydrate ABC transporter permease [Firmicutes bacterium]|nr:carbohydrate ABC transporter permease [Bacillota bacterium]